MSDRRVWWVIWVGLTLSVSGIRAESQTIERPGGDFHEAVIYLPQEPDEWEHKAAVLLQNTWQIFTGKEAVIQAGGRLRGQRSGPLANRDRYFYGWQFSIGETSFNRRWVPTPQSDDKEAFSYRSRRFHTGFRGNTPQAVYLAVTRFIQDEFGIYWLFPGKQGWALDQSFPGQGLNGIRQAQPGYLSRTMFGMRGGSTREWGERNGVFARFAFHHNLYRIFNEEAYEQHPEFFPLVRGQRVRPNNARGGANAQITFSNPQAAEFAAEKAIEYFDQNPDKIGFSLGINDTRTFSEEDQPWMDTGRMFRKVPDYSNLIFLFMNRAAEKLSEYYEDRYLGCLAYYVAENVPDFPVHPQVIPYLTADRNLYWDHDFREQDEELQRRWNESGVRYWGTYDYFYGSPYDHIRDYRHLFPLTTVAAYQRGARGATAEINPRWGINMPVPWVLAQLWWNPEQDVKALYQQFYRMAFGPAAETMHDFYQRGEQVWARQEGRAYWLRNYFHPIQWEWWEPEDFEWLEQLLEQARQQIAGASPYFARWELVQRDFQSLHAGWKYYSSLKQWTQEARLPTEEELGQILEHLRLMHARPAEGESAETESDLSEVHREPLAMIHANMQRRPEFGLVGALLKSPASSALTPEREQGLREWDQWLPEPIWGPYLQFREKGGQTAGKTIGSSDSWQVWRRPGSHPTVTRKGEDGPWEVRDAVEVRIFRTWPVTGNAVYQVSSKIAGRVTEGARVELQVYFRDAQGIRFPGKSGRAKIRYLLPGEYDGHTAVEYLVQAPAQAADMLIQQVVVEQASEDWVEFAPIDVTEWE